MRRKLIETGYPLAIALAVYVAGFAYFFMSERYPYYYSWDMDQTTTLDSIAVQAGDIPDHINHPGFGMYLLLNLTHKTAYRLGHVSLLDWDDVRNSLNPVAAIAELKTFFRRHSPVLAVAIAAAPWLALLIAFPVSKPMSLALFAMFASQGALFHNVSLIRTEFYGIFFWCLAAPLAALALQAGEGRKRSFLFIAAGVLLGLSYLTKLQALFHVLIFPLLVWFLAEETAARGHAAKERFHALLSLINLAGLGLVVAVAAAAVIPPGFAVFTKSYSMSPLALIFAAALLGLFLVQGDLLRIPRLKERLPGAHWIVSGFLLSFLLHFFMFPSLAQSLRYLSYNAKILFWRGRYESAGGFSLERALHALQWTLSYDFITYASFIGLASYFAWKRRGLARALTLSLAGMLLLNVALGTRPSLQDLIWKEILCNLLSAIFILLLVKEGGRGRLIAWGILGLLIVNNVRHSLGMRGLTDAANNMYGWDLRMEFKNVYEANELRYLDIMDRKYGQGFGLKKLIALGQADGFRLALRTASFPFPGLTITLRNVGLASETFPVWAHDQSYTLKKVPAILRGALLVDNSRIKPNDGGSSLAVLPRLDLDIFLYLQGEDFARLMGTAARPNDLTVTAASERGLIDLHAVKVAKRVDLPLDQIEKDFFFIIQRRLAW